MVEQELWQSVLNEVELKISKANFITWFKNTYISVRGEGVITIAVPNGFTKAWLENNYNKLIFSSLRNLNNQVKEVRYIIENKKPALLAREQDFAADEAEEVQLKLDGLQIDRGTNLNPKYTFDNFVVGNSNDLAHATALAIIKKPGTLYNPLFVYGGVGLGKTHLLQAMGNKLKDICAVIYLTSENFTNEFIESAQNKGVADFKNKYRTKDVLIIDDIQFIAGKERTQEEFFHTFNALHEQNKQIVISSDRPPKAIPTLDERLRSRFEGGMLVDIGYPDYETRLAILKTKLKDKNTVLPSEVLDYIANNIQKNIRELEGALNLVIASSRLYRGEVTLDQTKKILAHIIEKPQKPISYKKIFSTVASFYEIKESDLLGKNRQQNIVLPRQVVMYLMREEMKASYPYIGDKIGGRDHTTVMHACGKIENRLKIDKNMEEELSLIKQQIYSV